MNVHELINGFMQYQINDLINDDIGIGQRITHEGIYVVFDEYIHSFNIEWNIEVINAMFVLSINELINRNIICVHNNHWNNDIEYIVLSLNANQKTGK